MAAAAIALVTWNRRAPESLALPLASAGLAAALAVAQSALSRHAEQAVENALTLQTSDATILDVAMAPLPSNPICWTFHSIATTTEPPPGRYLIRSGVISIAPDLIAPRACTRTPAGIEPLPSAPNVALSRAYDAPLEDFRHRAATDCFFAAWLRFARIPLIDDGVAEDVRFSASPRGGNFTELRLADFAGRPCPTHVPQWTPPRTDLLGGE
jgi:inner membrane protein